MCVGGDRLFKYLEDFVSTLDPQVNCSVLLLKHKGGIWSSGSAVKDLLCAWVGEKPDSFP